MSLCLSDIVLITSSTDPLPTLVSLPISHVIEFGSFFKGLQALLTHNGVEIPCGKISNLVIRWHEAEWDSQSCEKKVFCFFGNILVGYALDLTRIFYLQKPPTITKPHPQHSHAFRYWSAIGRYHAWDPCRIVSVFLFVNFFILDTFLWCPLYSLTHYYSAYSPLSAHSLLLSYALFVFAGFSVCQSSLVYHTLPVPYLIFQTIILHHHLTHLLSPPHRQLLLALIDTLLTELKCLNDKIILTEVLRDWELG